MTTIHLKIGHRTLHVLVEQQMIKSIEIENEERFVNPMSREFNEYKRILKPLIDKI